MKSKKFLSTLLTSIFLLTIVSSTAYYGTFIDVSGTLSQGVTIDEGSSIDFEVDFISADPSANLNVKLYNSTYDLVYTFEDNIVPTNPSYKIYTITPAIYKLPGTYEIIIFGYTPKLTLIVNPEAVPTITLIGNSYLTLEVGMTYVEQGAIATDDTDGNITSSIIIDSSSVNTDIIGIYNVTYDVMDSVGNNAAQIIRTVNVVDTTAPVITLIGKNPFIINVRNDYVERGFIATDNYDGNLTSSVIINSTDLNTDRIGTYHITYDVMDASGNIATQVIRTVKVVSSGGGDDDDDNNNREEYPRTYYQETHTARNNIPTIPETIYLKENSISQSSWFQKLMDSIVNFFRRLL